MARVVVVSVAISCAISSLVTVLVLTLVLPSAVAAQEDSLHAEKLITVGPNGVTRARMFIGQGLNASVSVLDPGGQVRTLMGAGGPTGQEPETADFVVFAQDGKSIARLGTRNTPDSHAAGVNLVLADTQGHVRLDMLVDEDGTPAIHMLDAAGNVTWSAP